MTAQPSLTVPVAERMAANVAAMLAGTHAEEALADEAFAALSKLRDRLLLRDLSGARQVDEAIEALQNGCREFVK